MKNNIPDNWEWVKLKDACEIILGQSPPSSTYNEEGLGLPFFQGKAEFGSLYPEVVKWCTQPKKIAAEGDVLISVRAPVGATNLNPYESCIGRGLAALRPKNGMSNRYFLYLLRHIRRQLEEKATGTTFQAITGQVLRSHKIPLAPRGEQYRIVEEIEKQFTRLDAAVAGLRRVQVNLERYKAAVLKAACEGRLVPQEADLDPDYEPAGQLLERILAERRRKWEEQEWQKLVERAQKKVAQARKKAAGLPYYIRDLDPADWQDIPESEYRDYLPKSDKWKQKYKEPEPPDTDDLPELPAGWVWTTMDQLGEILGGLTKNSKRRKLSLKLPYLRVANVYANELRLEDVETIGVTESEIDRVLLESEDLLIVEGNGSIEQIGRVALWNDSISPCLHQNHIIKARLIEKKMTNFVLHWLLSPGGRNQITHVASSTSGLYTLSLSKVSMLPVPLPPLYEQERIVDEVERCISFLVPLAKSCAQDRIRSDRLRQSILQQAFSGKLVPRDEDPVGFQKPTGSG